MPVHSKSFSGFARVVWPWAFGGVPARYFAEHPSTGICQKWSLLLKEIVCFCYADHRSETRFTSECSRTAQHQLAPYYQCRSGSPGWHVSLFLFQPLFLGGHSTEPMLTEAGVTLHLPPWWTSYTRYLEFFCKDLSFFLTYLYSQSFIYISLYAWVFLGVYFGL